jgi:hypothetical protein
VLSGVQRNFRRLVQQWVVHWPAAGDTNQRNTHVDAVVNLFSDRGSNPRASTKMIEEQTEAPEWAPLFYPGVMSAIHLCGLGPIRESALFNRVASKLNQLNQDLRDRSHKGGTSLPELVVTSPVDAAVDCIRANSFDSHFRTPGR